MIKKSFIGNILKDNVNESLHNVHSWLEYYAIWMVKDIANRWLMKTIVDVKEIILFQRYILYMILERLHINVMKKRYILKLCWVSAIKKYQSQWGM
jgi:hypothetical protein